jgi:hypothetical protein
MTIILVQDSPPDKKIPSLFSADEKYPGIYSEKDGERVFISIVILHACRLDWQTD